jgi:drug/metabolite transporter (DMT)-like permease
MSPTKKFLLTLALASMWSPSFLFIKLAVEEIPPVTLAASRITIAASILVCILIWRGISIKGDLKFWFHASMMGMISMGIPFCLFSFAEQTIDSSLAAVLNGTTPMFTALLAHHFVPSDRMTAQKAIGIALCAAGLLFLFAPNLIEGMNGSSVGMLAVTFASFLYGVGHIYGKRYFTGHKPFVSPACALIACAVFLWPIALVCEQPYDMPMPSMLAISGVCGLAICGTVLAFTLYYKLLEISGPTAISLVACFFPVGGMLIGMVMLGEVFTFANMIASCIILVGMMIVNKVVNLDFLLLTKVSQEVEVE